MKNKKKVIALAVLATLLILSLLPFKDVSLDYWIWLGCPYPMLLADNYPGHDYTAAYRHENYFIDIPSLADTYDSVVSSYGEPIHLEDWAHGERQVVKAVYNDFLINYYKPENRDIGQCHIVGIVVTTDNLRFTRDKIRVGDKRERIISCYRYYKTISEPHDGYIDGYIDGSVLTGQTWVEFAYDENDCVKFIMLYAPI